MESVKIMTLCLWVQLDMFVSEADDTSEEEQSEANSVQVLDHLPQRKGDPGPQKRRDHGS